MIIVAAFDRCAWVGVILHKGDRPTPAHICKQAFFFSNRGGIGAAALIAEDATTHRHEASKTFFQRKKLMIRLGRAKSGRHEFA